MDLSLLNALSYLEKPDGLIALPGPESYVLAVRPEHPEALSRLRRIKGDTEPLLLLGRDIAAFSPFIDTLPHQAEFLMNRYWPGPLIILLDKSGDLPPAFSQHEQVKLLQPESETILDFLSLIPGGLLATLCAARVADPPARTAAAVYDSFGDDVDLILADDNALRESAAPTVISVEAGGTVHILRSGSIVLD